LAKRDAQDDPFATARVSSTTTANLLSDVTPAANDNATAAAAKDALLEIWKGLG